MCYKYKMQCMFITVILYAAVEILLCVVHCNLLAVYRYILYRIKLKNTVRYRDNRKAKTKPSTCEVFNNVFEL